MGVSYVEKGAHTRFTPASAIRPCIGDGNGVTKVTRDGNRGFSFLSAAALASVSEVAGKVAFKMMQFYPDYWAYTGDASYNPTTSVAILHQVGPDKNFMPPNQSQSLGNDDQCFWALTTMSAAEKRFPNPPDNLPQWLSLTQAVFNTQAARWDRGSCGGGLRWQIIPLHSGYAYKNTISTGCFFQLGTRLARYTGNATYAEWAEKTFDWTYNVLGRGDGNEELLGINCLQWSYNAGMYMAGAAYMYNFTNGAGKWKPRIQGILNGTLQDFFTEPPVGPEHIMYEVTCEPCLTCNVDQRSFKAYPSRFMGLTVKMAPFTKDAIMPVLYTSAASAAKQCSYGEDQNTCGQKWYTNEWDKLWGVGEQISALEVILSTLVDTLDPPVTQAKGGTSKGDPAAGGGGSGIRYNGKDGRGGGVYGWVNSKGEFVPHTPDKKDRVGSIVLTVVTFKDFVEAQLELSRSSDLLNPPAILSLPLLLLLGMLFKVPEQRAKVHPDPVVGE
ncbi:unnamed protein product [Tuber aestivum]|uniref:mannan endo-1,6-alpha-mannosidase n=1 Tax=Tuber aestivum TaxID=59557 RepID=A0A292PJS6_9PEZI|nr:unnamed protein product [Tuber aestivum]